MCQIFGAFSNHKMELNDYLKAFYANSDKHPNGWGLSIMDEHAFSLEKEPKQASKSGYLKNRLSIPVESAAAFAHIRYATVGNVKYQNCHPFTLTDKSGRRWVQNHNGTIFHCPDLERYVKTQTGDTDSERILMYVVDQINKAEANGPLDAEARFHILDDIVCKLSDHNNKLNYLLYDGELLYVHTNFEKSLHILKKDEGIFISTEPLTDEDWEPLPMNTLLAFRNGELAFTGTNHGHSHIFDEKDFQMLYLAFAEL